MDGQAHKNIDRQTDRQTWDRLNRQTDGWTDRHTSMKTDITANRQIDRWQDDGHPTNRRHRQTDSIIAEPKTDTFYPCPNNTMKFNKAEVLSY